MSTVLSYIAKSLEQALSSSASKRPYQGDSNGEKKAQDRAKVMIVQPNWEDFFSNLESFYKIILVT